MADVLDRHPHLRIVPSLGMDLTVAGEIHFRAVGPDGTTIEDRFSVRIRVPAQFPRSAALVWETGGRIPRSFHRLEDGALCLGAPTEIQLRLATSPTLSGFFDTLLIPYLFGRSYFEKFGSMPFGELPHDHVGLRQHFVGLFSVGNAASADGFAAVGAMHRRIANKRPCPCESGQRLGRCHHVRVNELRAILGREWFRQQVLEFRRAGCQRRRRSSGGGLQA